MNIYSLKPFLFLIFILIALSSCATIRVSSSMQNEPLKEDFQLYLLMGQSNMAGRGAIGALDTTSHLRVLMLNKNLSWEVAKDPIHFDKSAAGVGLGLTFGKIMADSNTASTIGLISAAVGGSSIDYWVRDSLFSQTETYPYNDMIIRAKQAMKEGRLRGILWHQGESDTDSEEAVTSYAMKFQKMIEAIKLDLGIEVLPMVIGELGYFQYDKNPNAKQLNTILNQIADKSSCISLVSAEGLDHKGDFTHFNSDSYHKLGKRYAEEMHKLEKSCPLVFKE